MPFVKRAAYTKESTPQIDIPPAQSEQFADSQASQCQGPNKPPGRQRAFSRLFPVNKDYLAGFQTLRRSTFASRCDNKGHPVTLLFLSCRPHGIPA